MSGLQYKQCIKYSTSAMSGYIYNQFIETDLEFIHWEGGGGGGEAGKVLY